MGKSLSLKSENEKKSFLRIFLHAVKCKTKVQNNFKSQREGSFWGRGIHGQASEARRGVGQNNPTKIG